MYFKFILILDICNSTILRCSDFYKSNDYIFFVVWMKNYWSLISSISMNSSMKLCCFIYILLILSAIYVLFDKLTSWRSFKWGRFIQYVKTKKKLNTWCLTFELWKLLLWFPLMDLYLWLLTDWDGTFVWEHQWCLDCELWLLGISPVKSAVRSQGKPNTPQSLRHEGWIQKGKIK